MSRIAIMASDREFKDYILKEIQLKTANITDSTDAFDLITDIINDLVKLRDTFDDQLSRNRIKALKIRLIRNFVKLTQAEFGRLTGMSCRTIQRIENEEEMISDTHISKICEALLIDKDILCNSSFIIRNEDDVLEIDMLRLDSDQLYSHLQPFLDKQKSTASTE